jgi:hypothetical protein
MGLNLATHGLLLLSGVWLRLPGMWVAAGAFSVAAIVEYIYLANRAARCFVPIPARAGLETKTSAKETLHV